MASRRVEAAFDGQSVELGSAKPPTNGTIGNNHQSSTTKNSINRHATPGKTTVLAIGRAVPTNTTRNDGLADRYIAQFQLQDPIVQAKLRRLCETTTVKTRYLVVNKEILDEHPDFLIEGAATVSQRLAITGMAKHVKQGKGFWGSFERLLLGFGVKAMSWWWVRRGGDAAGVGGGDGGDQGVGAAGVGDHAPGVRVVERDSAPGRGSVPVAAAGAAAGREPRDAVHAGVLRRRVGDSRGEGLGGEQPRQPRAADHERVHADRVQEPEPRPPLRPRGRGALRRRRRRHDPGRGPRARPGAPLLRARVVRPVLHPQHQQNHRRPPVGGGHQLQTRPRAPQAHRIPHPRLLRPRPRPNRRPRLQRHLLGRPPRWSGDSERGGEAVGAGAGEAGRGEAGAEGLRQHQQQHVHLRAGLHAAAEPAAEGGQRRGEHGAGVGAHSGVRARRHH